MMVKSALALVLLFVGVTLANEPIGRRKAVPVIYVAGSHYEVGYDVGRTFSCLIKSFIASYANLRRFESVYKTETGRAVYDTTLANMNERYPYYVKEMQGVADGANVPFYQLFLLQMDDLIDTVNDNHIPRNDTGGCTSILLHNDRNTVLGHTEDAFAETLNHFYIMSAHIIPTPEDREKGATEERFSSLCYAGHMPGYTMGFNENGLVYSINTLSPYGLKFGNTPRTFITRKLLSSRNFADSERILLDEGLGTGNGFSVNMIWSDAVGGRQLYNIEVAPDLNNKRSLVNIKKYDKDPLVHCNMYLRIKVKEVMGDIIDSSEARMKAVNSHPPPKNIDDVADLISDTSGTDYQVFQNKPDTVIKTIAAGIFNLDRRTWSIYINKPNASEPVAVLPMRFTAINGCY